MTDTIMISEVIRIDIGHIVKTGDSIDSTEADLGMNKIIGEEILEVMQGSIKILKDKNSRGEYRNSYRNEGYGRSRDRNRSREWSFSRNFSSDRNNRNTSNGRSRSGSRECMNRDRIRCYKCKEYDHFTKDCPTSREERELEQLQQMLNLDDEQT